MISLVATKEEVLDSLDHPIFFILVVAVAVAVVLAIFAWAAKAANVPGLAALFEH